MRRQPQTITLGDHQWMVRPLTVAQVQTIEPLLHASGDAPGTIASAVAILRVAIGRDDPDAAAGLDEVEAEAPEIATALAVVLRLGGFLPDAERREGATPGKPEADQPVP